MPEMPLENLPLPVTVPSFFEWLGDFAQLLQDLTQQPAALFAAGCAAVCTAVILLYKLTDYQGGL